MSYAELSGKSPPVPASSLPSIDAEVERLLSGRTRDIRLTGRLAALYQERIWPQTSKIIRSWLVWVAILDLLTLGIYLVLLPESVASSMLAPGAILPPAAIAVYLVWRKKRARWILGSALMVGLLAILGSVALVGISAGEDYLERHLTIMLFVATTAVIIFGIPLSWTISIASMALALYVMFQFGSPSITVPEALAGTLFFSCGIAATVVARRTINLLSQKAFLLELRDRRRVSELAEANRLLEVLARTDPLTGIANRRWMTETLEQLWILEPNRAKPMAMLMCDIDHFKKLNDRFGHAEGDRCLVSVANIIRENTRRDRDYVARYGGEEFLVILPGAGLDDAVAVGERIRESVAAAEIPNPAAGGTGFVTVSVGAAARPERAEPMTHEDLQKNADAALYQAKESGRNRVVATTA